MPLALLVFSFIAHIGIVIRFETVPFTIPANPVREWFIVDLINNRGLARVDEDKLESKLLQQLQSTVNEDLLMSLAQEFGKYLILSASIVCYYSLN